jgi:hypothetical protein
MNRKMGFHEKQAREHLFANVIRNWALLDQNFILNNLPKDIVKKLYSFT